MITFAIPRTGSIVSRRYGARTGMRLTISPFMLILPARHSNSHDGELHRGSRRAADCHWRGVGECTFLRAPLRRKTWPHFHKFALPAGVSMDWDVRDFVIKTDRPRGDVLIAATTCRCLHIGYRLVSFRAGRVCRSAAGGILWADRPGPNRHADTGSVRSPLG